ncbi:myelin-oligodendrocyte glycoprotein-like isoform X2 [Hemiscyllium ocellatum]|uniref:myelin-oligodendrocyte glycoprotein-like isoform X2 n=1 Tax=Hemiscyllium ocellatum TaxID=170820 RepID=UPI0029663415|nr:myelin-oligodendrocyte glycoprotein-like isoform X2 [Hemiscyllium ocellatum]
MTTVHFGLMLGLLLVGDSLPEAIQCEKNVKPVTAMQGSTVYLPCSFRSEAQPDKLLVSWQKAHRDYPLIVHAERRGGEMQGQQDNSFKGRTALPPYWYQTGSATLQLQGLRSTDSGNYTCYVRAEQRSTICASLRLTVNSAP